MVRSMAKHVARWGDVRPGDMLVGLEHGIAVFVLDVVSRSILAPQLVHMTILIVWNIYGGTGITQWRNVCVNDRLDAWKKWSP